MKTVSIPDIRKANHNQFLATPPERTISVTRLGVLIEKVVAAIEMPKLRLVHLTPILAYRSTVLPKPFHDDPADQIIVATAREEMATILTKDKRIMDYPHVKSCW